MPKRTGSPVLGWRHSRAASSSSAARSAPFAGGEASNWPITEKRSRAQRSCTRDPPRSATSALRNINEPTLSVLTEGRRRASSAGWRRLSESVHRRCAAGQRTEEAQQGGELLVEAAGKALE